MGRTERSSRGALFLAFKESMENDDPALQGRLSSQSKKSGLSSNAMPSLCRGEARGTLLCLFRSDGDGYNNTAVVVVVWVFRAAPSAVSSCGIGSEIEIENLNET